MAIAISEKDALILAELRHDCRAKIAALSRDTGVPATTLYQRMRQLHRNGIVAKNTCLVNFRQLGYKVVYFVLKSQATAQNAQLAEFLAAHCSTNSLARTNYDSDFLVECIFHDEKEAGELIDALMTRFQVSIQMLNVIEEMRREQFLTTGD